MKVSYPILGIFVVVRILFATAIFPYVRCGHMWPQQKYKAKPCETVGKWDKPPDFRIRIEYMLIIRPYLSDIVSMADIIYGENDMFNIKVS